MLKFGKSEKPHRHQTETLFDSKVILWFLASISIVASSWCSSRLLLQICSPLLSSGQPEASQSKRPKTFQGQPSWMSGLLSQQSHAFTSRRPKQHHEGTAMKKERLNRSICLSVGDLASHTSLEYHEQPQEFQQPPLLFPDQNKFLKVPDSC